ncbi:MAG: sigma-70 family RNA polymerase sigma factor [Planctomycetota bacterium]
MIEPPVPSETPSSLSLAEGLRHGDAAAWDRMVELYAPLARSWCLYSGVSADRVGDILQEVFLSVHRSIRQFEPRDGSSGFRGWVWQITRNKIRDHFRRENGQPVGRGGSSVADAINQFPDPTLPDDPPSQPSDTAALLHRALNMVKVEFRATTWDAFWRGTVLGQHTDQIAEELQLSPAAVRQAKSRVLRRLRQQLGDLR